MLNSFTYSNSCHGIEYFLFLVIFMLLILLFPIFLVCRFSFCWLNISDFPLFIPKLMWNSVSRLVGPLVIFLHPVKKFNVFLILLMLKTGHGHYHIDSHMLYLRTYPLPALLYISIMSWTSSVILLFTLLILHAGTKHFSGSPLSMH